MEWRGWGKDSRNRVICKNIFFPRFFSLYKITNYYYQFFDYAISNNNYKMCKSAKFWSVRCGEWPVPPPLLGALSLYSSLSLAYSHSLYLYLSISLPVRGSLPYTMSLTQRYSTERRWTICRIFWHDLCVHLSARRPATFFLKVTIDPGFHESRKPALCSSWSIMSVRCFSHRWQCWKQQRTFCQTV